MARSESWAKRWRRIIKQQQSSGLTVTAFCRKHAVPMSSFFAWKRRLRSRREEALAFVAVKTMDDAGRGDSGIELCMGQRWRVVLRRGFDHALLVEVLGVLEGKPSGSAKGEIRCGELEGQA